MASTFTNVLSGADISYIHQLPQVVQAKSQLLTMSSGVVNISFVPTESIRLALNNKLGLNLQSGARVPLRWIKGDTTAHSDRGSSAFSNTHLVYLNNSVGEFVVNGTSYPIIENTGFKFNEGVVHKTTNAGVLPRLLIGPLAETGAQVGQNGAIYYFSNQAAATTNDTGAAGYIGNQQVQKSNNLLTFNVGTNVVPNGGGDSITLNAAWRWAFINGQGTIEATQGNTGDSVSLSDTYDYRAFPVAFCFLEGTNILCNVDGADIYVPIEKMTKGILVKTYNNGYKALHSIGTGTIHNSGSTERIVNHLYKCSPKQYPELKEDLFITGAHSILVNSLTEKQRIETRKTLGDIFITEKKYRLPAYVDERCEPWLSKGIFNIWHIALENDNISKNYGVYANGLLVESCSINFLNNKSRMTLA